MAFSGTLVVSGRATGVVVGTGSDTEMGRINRMLQSVSALETPLLRQIRKFGLTITTVTLVVSALVFAYGHLVRHMLFRDIFQAVVAIAVSIIPEGLPAIITITLAIGNNIEKAMLHMLPTNVAQGLVILVAIFAGLPSPITAPQILWVNMVTSVALAVVIAFEPHELDVMRRPPRAVDRPILTGFGVWRILFVGVMLLLSTLAEFFWTQSQVDADDPEYKLRLARTVAVNALTIGQVFYLPNSRYLLDSSLSLKAHFGNRYLPLGIGAVLILQLLFTYAPPFQALFKTEGLLFVTWLRLLLGGFLFFLLVEAEKWVLRMARSGRSVPIMTDTAS